VGTVKHALLVLAAALLACSIPRAAYAAEYYVATTGSDSADGTQGAPFKTVGRAQTAAAAGDTVWIRGGTYAFTGSGTVGVAFSKSGGANSLIKYFAYAGEIPIFDLSGLSPSGRVTGLDVHCNYIHLRGLEVKGVRQYMSGEDSWGVRIQGNNNVLENLNVHHNQAPGIFITSGAGNRVVNCDSHHNNDVLEKGLSGDGFGCHSSGGNNVLTGCRAYENSDDGFDFINAGGSCIVEKSFSFRNGYEPDTMTHLGNGAGFKAGGYGSPPTVSSANAATHTVRQCVAFNNYAQGFYANHHPGRINFYNNTAFNNPTNYNMLSDAGYASSHEIRNNIAMTTGTAIANLNGGTATFNSWNLQVTVSAADFLSVATAEALTARQADGNLPNVNFMHLAAGSDLIDKGTDVGLPFNGSAPDLGAFESGGSTGGAPSSGGAPSTGGTVSAGGTTNSGGAAGGGGAQSRGGSSSGGASGPGGSGGGSASAAGTPSGGGTTVSTGGSVATSGGSNGNAGNTSASGGAAAATGGSTGTVNTGGAANSSGGTAPTSGGGVNSAGTNSAGSPLGGSEPGGCGCRMPASSSSPFGRAGAIAIAGLLLAGGLRRRRARA
jgi:hypothetical protein